MMEKADIDKMMPLRISPKPEKEVRVMLIRFECLSKALRADIEKWIADLAHKEFRVRKAAEKKLVATGRIGEAVMRSAFKEAEDLEVKMSLKEVLEKITPKNPN